jgi:UDP-2-acetamido-3-amino-2,3-dideoxy-glucuronate N-acetyltransferase
MAGPSEDIFIHESAYVDEPCQIGPGTKIWHFVHILRGCVIGANCVIGQNVMIGPEVRIGNDCKIQNNVSLYKGVELEDGVFCGPSCVFTNVNTPRAEIERKNEFLRTLVRRGATIGANSTIVCGVEVGAYSFIGAGAVITKDVPPHALMVGVPARRIGWVSHAGERLDERLVCPRSGIRYRVMAQGLECWPSNEKISLRDKLVAPLPPEIDK